MMRNRKSVFCKKNFYFIIVLFVIISMMCQMANIVGKDATEYNIQQYDTELKEILQKGEIQGKIKGKIQGEIQENLGKEKFQVGFRTNKTIDEERIIAKQQVVEGITEDKLKKLKDETTIDMDICSDINLTKDEFIYIMSNFKYDEQNVLKDNSILIWEFSKKYNINPMVVVGVMGLESGYGKSLNAINNNNLFGLSNSKDGQKMKSFTSKGECIAHFCKHLSENYLCEDGIYYVGSTKLKDVNIFYNPKHNWEECNCFDESGRFIGLTCNFDFIWSKSVVDCMYTIYNNIVVTT